MKNVHFLLLALLTCASCNDMQPSKRKTTDIFLGIYLGMDRKEFFDHCWKLNKDSVVVQGPGNQSVEYQIPVKEDVRIIAHFYPNFYKDRIYEMPVVYNYAPWAPWNRQYGSHVLLDKLVQHYDTTYGKMNVLKHRTMGKVYYRIDGRRRINLFIKDDQYVQAVFTDLRVERELKRQQTQ